MHPWAGASAPHVQSKLYFQQWLWFASWQHPIPRSFHASNASAPHSMHPPHLHLVIHRSLHAVTAFAPHTQVSPCIHVLHASTPHTQGSPCIHCIHTPYPAVFMHRCSACMEAPGYGVWMYAVCGCIETPGYGVQMHGDPCVWPGADVVGAWRLERFYCIITTWQCIALPVHQGKIGRCIRNYNWAKGIIIDSFGEEGMQLT